MNSMGHQINVSSGAPSWRDSDHVCAFADDERHLGHIVLDDDWIAYDATHSSGTGGILELGSFSTPTAAKAAVEQSIASGRIRARAGAVN
jgi:hypothetical protein